MNNQRLDQRALALSLLLLAAPAAACAQSGEIRVTVNNDLVAFATQPPVQRLGTVLVPLRGVFEKLGASVLFDNASKTILATKGPTTVSLRLGQAQAVVNGAPRTLSTPAQAINGTTLVPLRFVSEALGAQVRWEAALRVVRITTDALVAGALPLPTGTSALAGTITGFFPETSSLTVRIAGGENARVALGPDLIVLVKSAAQGPATATTLAALRVGDQVTIRRDEQGRASVVEATYGEKRGEVKSIQKLPSSGNYVVTLSDGSIVELAAGVPVQMAGRSVGITDVRPGETVVIRVNPQTQQGIGVAVVTADNPAPAPPATLEVTSLTHGAGDRALKAGETLTITLVGTPGARATFSIPGVPSAQNLPLAEASPGRYTGTFTVPAGLNVPSASLLGVLTQGQSSSPVIQAAGSLSVDAAGPTLANLSPAEGSSQADARPLLYGTFSDAGSGVAQPSTRLVVNGVDATPQATITEAFFSFRPAADLPAGKNTATIVVRDAAGNETRRDWSFTVAPAVNVVKSLSVSPEGKTLEAGDVVSVRMEATPGGAARFALGGVVVDRALREEPAGVYTGTYTVKKGDSLAKAPVVVTFTAPGGQAITQTAAQSVTIAAGTPDRPVIDSPQEGVAVSGNGVVVAGRAAPNALVRVGVSYQGRLLILPASGAITTVEVRAGVDGKWTTETLRLDAPFGVSQISYTVEAVVVDAAGSASEPTTVRFKR